VISQDLVLDAFHHDFQDFRMRRQLDNLIRQISCPRSNSYWECFSLHMHFKILFQKKRKKRTNEYKKRLQI